MKRYLPFLLAALFLLPLPAWAQFGPIVPEICRACPCGFGGVLAIVQNVVNFMIAIAVIVATIIIAWGGLLYILSSTNPESRSTANKMLINAAIGLLITLSAWLIVDFVMKTLYGGQFGPWNSILLAGSGPACVEAKPSSPLFSGDIIAVPGTGGANDPVTGAEGCPNCVSLAEKGIECKSASSCRLNPTVADRLVKLKNDFSGTWIVTEGHPPTVNHSNRCHREGTCVDVGFRGNTTYTGPNVAEFATAARLAGLRAVFETDSCALRDEARRRGATAYCRSDNGYGHITGNHFSVYPQ